jgi:uncharacterized membrane protein YccC
MKVLDALRKRDANLSALRRSGRVAIVMPAMFAIADKVLDNPQASVFAAFGCFAMLLFADFGGPMATRVAAHLSLVAGGVVLVCLGTLAGQATWLAVLMTFVVALVVLFAGVVSSVLASATTALLVSFILPVTLGGSVSTVPDRLVGWLLAGGSSLIAIVVLWPSPPGEPLRASTARCCGLLARRLRTEADCLTAGPAGRVVRDQAVADASAAVAALRTSFYASPYRPTGLATSTRMLVRLVDELVWLNVILERTPLDTEPAETVAAICALKLSAADVLEHCGTLLETGSGDPRRLEADLARLSEARLAMAQTVISDLPVRRVERVPSTAADAAAPDVAVVELVDSLEPSFRAQEMSFGVTEIAANTELAVLARERPWWRQLLGYRPEGGSSALSSATERAGAHLQRNSVWLHNSLRGAFAIAIAVLVADEVGVQHGFWVVLGTLAVLRSNALTTGQNILRAMIGTTIGFVLGAILLILVGNNTSVYWGLFPPAIFFAGLAPAVIGFAAGQAGFTVALLVLYNLIAPTGWHVGLVRVEDIAIGAGVSLVAGMVFWPRGAGPEFGRVVGDAFTSAVAYLRAAVDYGMSRCDHALPAVPEPSTERRQAAAAARRLDDAFRSFLAEKGTKHVPLAEVTSLVTVVAALRLAGDAVINLWSQDDGPGGGDRTAARQELLSTSAQLDGWYEQAAAAVSTGGTVPAPLQHDDAADSRLVNAVRRDLQGEDGQGTGTAVKMIWTADHLDIVRGLQTMIVPPAQSISAAWPRGWRGRLRQTGSGDNGLRTTTPLLLTSTLRAMGCGASVDRVTGCAPA